MRIRNSTGGRAREPVMNRLVTTVCHVLVRSEAVGNRTSEETNLDGGKKHTEDGQKETSVREVHLTITDSGHGSANHEGKQRSVGHGTVATVVPDAVQEDGEHGGKHAH